MKASDIRLALRWAPHNVVGHSLMSICHCVGLNALGNWAHDVTLPRTRSASVR